MILGARRLKLEALFFLFKSAGFTIEIRCAAITFLARTAIVCRTIYGDDLTLKFRFAFRCEQIYPRSPALAILLALIPKPKAWSLRMVRILDKP
jgi:hypothetical protein